MSSWSPQGFNTVAQFSFTFICMRLVLSSLSVALHMDVFRELPIGHHSSCTSHTHWATWFLCLVSEGKSEALMAGIDCWKVILRRSSRVCEQTMRFFLAYITKPPRHEFVGSCALNSGRNFSLSTVTTQGMSSLPSRAATWESMEDLYS